MLNKPEVYYINNTEIKMIEERKLVFKDGILLFPCGLEINITLSKLRWTLTVFKLVDKIPELEKYNTITLEKPQAMVLKDYLERD